MFPPAPLHTARMLEIEALSVDLGARRVLHEVSFSVEQGKVCVLLGPNGSGKSTLLRTLAGLVAPSSGQLRWGGEPLPRDKRLRARLVAFLPQSFGGGSEMTVEEMAMLGRTPHLPPYGTPSREDRDIVSRTVARIAPEFRGRKLGELSGGERARALLPRVLATGAPILLLDEPVASLDVRFQHEITGLVRRITREENLATIISLHGLNLAASIADSLVLLDDCGHVAAQGAPSDVMQATILERVYGMPMSVAPHPLSGVPQAQSLWKFGE